MNLTREEKFLTLIAAQKLEDKKITAIRSEIREGLDWSQLVNRALYEGLASFLYRHLHDLGLFPLIPKWVEETLQRTYHNTVFHNLKILRFLNDLGKILKQEDIPVIVLQGAALLFSVYEDMGIRPMEDIDLMVMPSHKMDLKRILAGMGFSPHPIYPDTYQKGIIYIDFHTDPFSSERIRARRWIMSIDPIDFWDSAIPLLEKELPIYRLSPFNNLIALSSHLLKHNFERLKWFVDVQEIILNGSDVLNWEAFASHCQKSGGERCVLYVLLLMEHFLSLRIPNKDLKSLGEDHLFSLEKIILRLRLSNKEIGRLSQILWLFLIREKKKKIYFILENIFPKKEIMAQIFPSSPHTLSIFVLRLIDLLSHGLHDLSLAIRAIIQGDLPRL